MAELTDLNVNFISIVNKGANRKAIVYKSDDGGVRFEFPIRIAKTDSEKGIIYGVVYEPNVVDTQGDWASADTIERAAHSFVKQGKVSMIDTMHNYQAGQGGVVESFIKNGEAKNYPEAKDGAWLVAIEPEEPVKARVKSGELGGLSLAGTAAPKEGSAPSKAATKGAARIVPVTKGAKVHMPARIY